MFQNSVLDINLMSQEIIAVEIVKYLLYLLRYDIKCDENPEKSENELLEKNLK
jgi:hypothetical protein